MTTSSKAKLESRLSDLQGKIQAAFKRLGNEGLQRIERNVTVILLVVGGGYVVATVSSAFIMQFMMSKFVMSKPRTASTQLESVLAPLPKPPVANFRDIMRDIKDRNLFNSTGEYPEEKFGGPVQSAQVAFDIEAPCRPTALPIELLGTIYLGNAATSIATVKDKSYSEADVYRAGDEIIGSEGALVAAVERESLIINNNGVKECIELAKPVSGNSNDGFPAVPGVDSGSQQAFGGGSSEVQLEASYVESELGPGFAKVMDAARFVPNTSENGTNGFKIFSIKPGSLLSRIGLQNNDVITQVNDTSLKNPDQGFAFYQALQDEKEVRLQVLRGGNMPVNMTVRIK